MTEDYIIKVMITRFDDRLVHGCLKAKRNPISNYVTSLSVYGHSCVAVLIGWLYCV